MATRWTSADPVGGVIGSWGSTAADRSMTLTQSSPLDAADLERIARVCSPCRHYIEASCECRLLYGAAESFLEVFESKPCKPRDYLLRFFEARIRRTREPNPTDRAEDLAHALIQQLGEVDSRPSFLSRDLIGMRRFLAARAEHLLIDERRKSEGRMRCGNCKHHRHAAGARRCDHPNPEHPWSGRVVVASEDPRRFDPPCHTYESGRKQAQSLDDALETAGFEPAAREASPLQRLESDESAALLSESFAEVQRQDPVAWSILHQFFFRRRTLGEIATELRVSSKTVMRKKAAGLELLQAALAARGIDNLEALS
jgi:hypothetical protein